MFRIFWTSCSTASTTRTSRWKSLDSKRKKPQQLILVSKLWNGSVLRQPKHLRPASTSHHLLRSRILEKWLRTSYLLTGEGWFLTGEMLELIHSGAPNIVCTQPFACLPNHVVGKGVIKELRRRYPESNIVAIDFDPGASEVNQLNRLKLMLSTANKNLNK